MQCHPCEHSLKGKLLLTPEEIIRLACIFFNVKEKDLKSKSRRREVCQPRQMVMKVIKEDIGRTLVKTGSYFSGRGHDTVIHSIQTVDDLCDTDPEYKDIFTRFLKFLGF